MKPFLLFTLTLLVFRTAFAQNLVLNPSFEQYISCPTSPLPPFNNHCIGWKKYTLATPDYFNSCINFSTNGIPQNYFGSQTPAHGNAYAGLFDYHYNLSDTSYHYREYITNAILPLQIGNAYEVSYSVSLADDMEYASNGLGAYFFDKGPSIVSTINVLPIVPQVSFSGMGPITDKTNWTRLTGYFIADSAYDNIVIGGFFNNNQIPRTLVSPNFMHGAYYYIDSVVLQKVDTNFLYFTDSLLCVGDTISVPYTVSPGFFSAGNVFTLQLSNTSGSFASPLNLATKTSTTSGSITCVVPAGITPGGGYRLRITASNPVFIFPDNGRNISIGNSIPAKPVATNNGPVCAGDTLNLSASTVTSGVTWSWSGPNSFTAATANSSVSNPLSNASGDYIVTVYSLGCYSKDTTTVLVKPKPAIPGASSNSPVCSGNTLNLTANSFTPGVSYTWTGPSFTSALQNPSLTNSQVTMSGSYNVKTTLDGCTSLQRTINVLIRETPHPTAAANGPVCTGDTIKLSSSGGFPGITYLWQGPASFNALTQNATVLNPATTQSGYYVITFNNNGCTGKDSVMVVVKPTPAAASITSNSPVCEADILNISISNITTGASYSWSGPNGFTSTLQSPSIPNVTQAAAGTYKLTISLDGCAVDTNAAIVVKQLPTTPAAANNGPLCSGDVLLLTSTSTTPGVSYSWSGPSSFFSPVQNPVVPNSTTTMMGTYTVSASLNGCTSFGTTNVVIKPLSIPIAKGNSPVCEGDTIKLTSGNGWAGATYSWTGPGGFSSSSDGTMISPASQANAGDYFITHTLNGCEASDTITVAVNPLPTQVDATSNTPVCEGEQLKLIALGSNATDYTWTGPGGFSSSSATTEIEPVLATHAGYYRIKAGLDGCYVYDTVYVTVKPTPVISTQSNSPLCLGDTLELSVFSSLDSVLYHWSGPDHTSEMRSVVIASVNDRQAGSYQVKVIKDNCAATAETIVKVLHLPAADLGADKELCAGKTEVIGTEDDSVSYSWSNGDTACCLSVTQKGAYILTKTNYCGSVSDTIAINTVPCDNCILVPSAFTPNKDGKNDGFSPIVRCNMKKFSFGVYNRWGARVFYSTDEKTKWDGTYNGVICDIGTYQYLVQYQPDLPAGANTDEVVLKGDVTLIR